MASNAPAVQKMAKILNDVPSAEMADTFVGFVASVLAVTPDPRANWKAMKAAIDASLPA